MSIAFVTLGCKVNRAETEELARVAVEQGYSVVDPPDGHVFIVNTCTVTRTADAKGRQLLRRLHRQNPTAIIVATGCYTDRNPSELQAIEGVSLVVPRRENGSLLAVLGERFGLSRSDAVAVPPRLRTRALVKIQDGCNLRCTYCIIPKVRGPGCCRPIHEVITEVALRVDEGHSEVVLTGIDIGSYYWEGYDLSDLVAQLLSRTDLSRLRLTSLHPSDLSSSLLSKFEDARLCPHLHVPLQSGSNRVLRAMGRRYNADEFFHAVTSVRAAITDVAITTDVIVGFPGETDRDFEQTLALCREVGFSWIHVFPFSPRPGTPAGELPPVNERAKLERVHKLCILANESRERFQTAFLERSLPVLWEKQMQPGVWTGLTPNYIRVFTHSQQSLAGRIRDAKLTRHSARGTWGELL